MPATLFDVAAVADPGFVRSEAICFELEHVLARHDVHPVVGITAVATLLSALLVQCPAAHRTAMTDSVLNDLRNHVRESLD
jgi:hypothetical protein